MESLEAEYQGGRRVPFGNVPNVGMRLRLVGESLDPHVLCFGPSFDRRFFCCLARAHAVVPYRAEEGRVYVYDPNYPGDRGRFVDLRCGGFVYDGFRSLEGWGVVLLPLSACLGRHPGDGASNWVKWTRTDARTREKAGGTYGGR